MKKIIRLLIAFAFILSVNFLQAQSPGLIVRPAGGNGVSSLNPNGDGYSSQTLSGYTTDDITQSELAYKVVPVAFVEPTGDLSTGPSGGYTDIVTRVDGSGFYMFKDATNIYFRLRIGGIISGSKGYSVLIDTDGKMGASGPAADPNYVAPSGNNPGNPGFEYEVELQTNFQVAVYNIDGTATPGAPSTFTLASNSQISVALSTDGNNPDYFYDWFVPVTAIGSPASIRTATTTVSSPNSALQGTRSDIYGINDANYANTAGAWQTVVNAQPPINLTTFTGVQLTCTAAPTVNTPISAGSGIAVTGVWTRMDATKPSSATITLYKNGSSIGTTTVSSGATWSINSATVANGDVFYAKALATGESECLQSNNVTATACVTPPAAPVLTCGSLKGISGTIPSTALGNSVLVYLVPATNASPASNLVSTGINITYPTATSFAFYTNGCSGGSNNVATGTYMIVTQNGSCISSPSFVCISSGSSGTPPPLSSNALAVPQPLYPSSTAVSGTGAASGDILRLYINGQYQASITAAASAFSFTGVTLNAGDQIIVYSQTGSACITQSATFTVSCFTPAPVITTNATGNLLSGASSVSGTSAYPGASVQLYKGTAPSGVATGAAATVNSSGVWTVTVPALANAENYYAIQTVSGCSSAASSAATVLTPAVCPSITGSYTDASVTVTGTMPSSFTGTIRLYQDGALIGSQAISAATAWSITPAAATLYYNGVLTATAQASGGAESSGCSSSTVGCTAAATPSITPTSSTITSGQTVSYTVSNVAAGNWYALLDNSGVSYATSVYKTSGSSFSLVSNPFSSAGTYSLRLSANALNGCPASFAAASVTVNAALPLLLLNFTGTNANNHALLSWSTSNEINVSHFELEESKDGINFTRVTIVQLQNTNALVHYYSYQAGATISAVTYYRLRIVDNDGKQQLSKSIVLRADSPHAVVKAGPNPFTSQLIIYYAAPETNTVNATLTDVYGRRLRLVKSNLVRGDNKIILDGLGRLAAGTYFLQLTNADGTGQQLFKVQKNK